MSVKTMGAYAVFETMTKSAGNKKELNKRIIKESLSDKAEST